jgi:protocatechuate 3,4-dioxygenase, alpha subunit
MSDAATSSQTVGPFFSFCLTAETDGRVVGPLAGERIQLVVAVWDGDGCPVPDAIVEIWQDAGGSIAAFGRMGTGDDGVCTFETVRSPHINVCLFARGLLRHLQTRIYFAGDPQLATDPVLALVPEARRPTLLATRDDATPSRWRFDLRLQGADETVFFDA